MDKIDLRDLRINNWIYHKDCPIPLQVNGFNGNEVYLKHSFEHNRTVGFVRHDRPSVCNINDIQPVPLTKEILEKNFKWSQYRMFWYCEEDTKVLIEESGDIWYLMFDDCDTLNHLSYNFEFVHQLQNILRDLGIVKEISI